MVGNMKNDQADKCMDAFKQVCDEADRSELAGSDECAYWVFERGYQAALQEMAIKTKPLNAHKPIDVVSDMLANGFALLEGSKKSKQKSASHS